MAEPETLYEDGQLKVEYCPKQNLYWLHIGNSCYCLPFLDDLAISPRGGLAGKLDLINPAIVHDVEQHGMTVDSIGMALAQARISELEDELAGEPLEG